MTDSSFKSSLRAFSVLGGGQFASLLSNVIKMKFAAALLGPAGVGLVGIFSNLVQTGASIAALGLGTGGSRQVSSAYASGSEISLAKTRRALFWLTAVLAFTGAIAFLALSRPIARIVLDNEAHAGEVAILSVGVALTVIVGSQAATLAGVQRVGDLARVDVGSGVFGAGLGILALWFLRDRAPVIVVLIAPAASVFFGCFFISRLSRPRMPRARVTELIDDAKPILQIGVYAVYWGVAFVAGSLAVRALIQRNLGYDASGIFQAAWAIGLAYQGFITTAVVSDFFPRLTAVINDHPAAVKLVNEQIEIGLLVCSPIAMAVLGFAPWVIRLMYTADFLPAVGVLRWLILGDMVKLTYLPLGYVLIAVGSARIFAINQTLAVAAFVLISFLGLPSLGLAAAGIAYLVMWVVFIPIPLWTARRQIGFRWSPAVLRQVAASLGAGGVVALVGSHSDLLGAVVGGSLTLVTAAWALVRISDVMGEGNRLSGLARRGRRFLRFGR